MTVIGKKDKVIIELSRNEFPVDEIQSMIDWIRYKKLTSKSNATEKDIKEITKIIKKGVHKRFMQNLK